jgi:hypothetical protein
LPRSGGAFSGSALISEGDDQPEGDDQLRVALNIAPAALATKHAITMPPKKKPLAKLRRQRRMVITHKYPLPRVEVQQPMRRSVMTILR